MEVKVNNSEQNINLTLAQGENPINIQLKPSEPQDISVSLKPKSSPLEFAIATPIVRPIHFGLAPNVIKEIISGGSHLYDLYDVQADGNSVFGALADAVLTYDTDGRWKAVLPSELTITKNGDPVGTYKLRGKNQTIDITVPTLLSQLSNDKGYITEEELEKALSSVKGFQFYVVDVLPTPSEDTLGGIYLVRKLSNQSGNYYEEYITITRGGGYVWEKIGDTSINLSGYATKEDLEDAVDKSREYTDNKSQEIKDYVEGVRKEVIDSVDDTIKTTTEQIVSTQEHLIEVEQDLRETSERLDEESERLRNVKAELDGELTLAQIEIDKANASIESVAVKVDESAGTINEVKETLDATNLTLSETVTKLDENTGNITQIRNELNGIDETIVSVIESQVEDEDSKLIQTIGLLVDNKNKEIELAVKAIQEGTDESTISWVGQKIDAADQEIKTAIETMIYGEGYTETKTIGQVIDGKMDEITTQVLKSEELVGENGVIQQNINGAYTQWGIDSIKNNVSAISGVLTENGELIDVKTEFTTIEQDLNSILLAVGETEDYGGETILEKFAAITLKIDQVGLSVTNGDNYAAIVAQINKEGSEVLIEADKIHLLGETVAEQLTAQSATIGNLTLTNAVVSGTINANAGNIGGWQIGPANEKGTYLYGGNLILSSEGYIKNQQGDKVRYILNNDGSGSLADGNIWWDNEGALYFSGNAIVVTEDSEASQGKALAQLVSDVSKVLSMFDIDTANNAVYVKGDRNFYAFGEITALGQGTGGSGGSGEGGKNYLNELLDVNLLASALTTGDMLMWDSTRGKYTTINRSELGSGGGGGSSVDESDPIFKASAAYGITTADISNWNSIRSAIPTALSDLANDVGYITSSAIPSTYAWSAITGKPSFAAVATSGSYNDLSNKPTIPSIAGLASESWVTSNFLGLGGGTIDGNIVLNGNITITRESGPIYINTTSATLPSAINFFKNLVNYGGLGMSAKDTPCFLDVNNVAHTLIHSGNIGSYGVTYVYSGYEDLNSIVANAEVRTNDSNSLATPERNYPIKEAGSLLSMLAAYGSTNQIYGSYNTNRWFARGGGKGTSLRTIWREFAFTDSNVTSATKLQTGRYLWGNYFSGEQNISSALFLNSGGDGIYVDYNGINYHNSGNSWIATNINFQSDGGLWLSPYGGNVGIGTASPAYKLDVNGPIAGHEIYSFAGWMTLLGTENVSYSTYLDNKNQYGLKIHYSNGVAGAFFSQDGNTNFYGNIAIDAAYGEEKGFSVSNSKGWMSMAVNGGGNSYISTSSQLAIYTNNSQKMLVTSTGNVGIGTTEPREKLEVIGNVLSYGTHYLESSSITPRHRCGTYIWEDYWCVTTRTTGGTYLDDCLKINLETKEASFYGDLNVSSDLVVNGYTKVQKVYIGKSSIALNRNSDTGGRFDTSYNGWQFHSDDNNMAVFTEGVGEGVKTRWLYDGTFEHYGNITASGEITALGSSSSSDRRLKDIVSRPTPLTLEDIAKLNIISFKWNHRENDKRLKIGLVAQEVQEILPELVGVDRSNYLTLDYSTFGSVVGVMNTKRILSLEEEVIALKKEVKELRRKIYG